MATCHNLSGAMWRKHCSPTFGQPPPDHRSTVVNGGQYRRTTAGPPSTAAVNDGQRWRTTGQPPLDHRRTTGQSPVNDGRPPVKAGQQLGHGPGGVRYARKDDHGVSEGREDVREVFQQCGSGAKRKLSRCGRNQMGNEPILALPEGADDFVVYYDARSKDLEACLEKGEVLMPRVVKSRDEIFSRWGYCDNHDLSRLDNQSIERDRLIGIGFVLNFVKFISFTFGDKEMISVIEAVSR
ncbi:hypothetical protein Tco_1393191 [Tanacetum coccineum]